MQNYNKILKFISSFLENGILNIDDLRKELITSLKFKKDKIVNDLQLVKKEEFSQLKRQVENQGKILKSLKKKNKKSRRQ